MIAKILEWTLFRAVADGTGAKCAVSDGPTDKIELF